MSGFRQYLVDRIAELEAALDQAGDRFLFGDDLMEVEDEIEVAKVRAELEALQRVLEKYDDDARHDPGKVCQCCTAARAERSELIALTEEIREAGRALATLAEHRMDGCHGAHGPNGRCAGCERDEAISAWAKASWRWSTRERAGGQSDG